MYKEISIRRVYLFLLIICSFLHNSPTSAQNVESKIEHIGVEQGLSNRKVNDIIQDKNGFLWFATDNGLNKYDGYKFTVYKNDPDDPFSISHNKVNTICNSEIYDRQVIWIGTEGGGLNAFDVELDRFINWKKEKTDTSWDAYNNATSCVFYDSAASELKMYYTSFHGSDNNWKVGLATAKVNDSLEDFEWIKYEGNPILTGGEMDDMDSKGVTTPCVIKHDGLYKMWYAGISAKMDLSIGYATSKDGIHWIKYENNPVLSEDLQPTWKNSNAALFPSVIYDGKKYHMWYGANDYVWEQGKIGHATSLDGINWLKDKKNPVISAFPKGHWGDKIVGGPSVFYKDGLYFMIYTAKSFTPYKASYHALALSKDGSVWKRYDKPILEVNHGIESHFWSPWVLPFNDKYHLWYTEGGVDYASKTTANFVTIRYAYSTDLKNWKRKIDNKIWKENHTCLTSNFVRSVHYDRSGSVWIGLFGEKAGLNRIIIPGKDKWFDLFLADNNNHSLEIVHYLNSNSVYDITEDDKDNLWIAANTFGVFKYDPSSDQFNNYTIISEAPNYLSSFSINSVYCDNKNTVWCGLENGELLKISGANNSDEVKKTKYTFQNLSEVKKIYSLDSENLILCLQNGKLEIFNKESGNLVYPENIITNNNLLLAVSINSIFEDNTTITWIGTDNGIIKIDPSKKKFTAHNLHMNDKGTGDKIHVTSILEPKDVKSDFLWIGTKGKGILKYKPRVGLFEKYSFTTRNSGGRENTVNTMFEDKQGTIWIGTPQTLNRFDPATESHFIYRKEAHDLSSVSGAGIYSLLEDKTDRLWIGSANGLQWHDRDNNIFPYVMAEHVNAIYELEYAGKRALLLGMYENGIRELDLDTYDYEEYLHDPKDVYSISNNNVNVIIETDVDEARSLLIGTDGGLNIVRLDEGDNDEFRFTHYDSEDGLTGNIIHGIVEDKNGIIWLSTNKGLSKFDPVEKKFRNYDKSDGLLGDEFSPRSYLKSRRGELFFGNLNGLISFNPDSLKDNVHLPNIVMTDFQVFNKSVEIMPNPDSISERFSMPKHISLLDTLILSYEENVFSLEFAAMDYHNPQKNKYAYMMEGFENEWNYTDANRRRVTYTNLDPGEYVFRVIGSNNDNYWNDKGKSLLIIITPPWWKTTSAYISYILTIMILVYAVWKFQLNRIQLKHSAEFEHLEAEKYREMDTLKSRFFANISHEFRTPLTLIIGPVEKILKNTKEFETVKYSKVARRNAQKLLNLINQLLDLSKLEVNKMKLKANEQNIVPFLKYQVMSFNSLAERKNIMLKFLALEEEILVYFDKEIMSKIMYNLISNALKFTDNGGRVDVSTKKVVNETILSEKNKYGDGYAEICVADTGIGIPEDQIDKIFDRFYQVDGSHTREKEGSGIGLSITKEFIELQKGEISVSSDDGKGTKFTLRFPLGRDHLSDDEIMEVTEKDTKYELYIDETAQLSSAYKKFESVDLDIPQNSDKPIIMIVEDNEDVRNYIKDYLAEQYNIVEAENGIEGLNKAIEIIPDLILSDIMMPKLNGIELCDKLKNDEKTSHIPIILLTAKASGGDKIEGLETGADDYIMKPFNVEELKVRIKNLIDQRRKLREYFKKQGMFEIEEKSITPADKKFLNRAINIINDHLSDYNFNIDLFAAEMALSRSQLHRKFTALYNESPSDFIRRIRLSKAAQLIEHKFGNISEIAYEVGFNNPSYFTKSFKEHFNITPTKYEQNI